MVQCLHLDTKGRRCRREAEEGRPFCPQHDPEGLAEAGIPFALRRLLLRLAALILLIIFLVPLAVAGYRLLKALLN